MVFSISRKGFIVGVIFLFLCLSFYTIHGQGKHVILGAEDTPPYIYKENNRVKGLLAEIVRGSFKDAGYNVEIVILPPGRMKRQAQEGEIDGIIGIIPDKKVYKELIFSEKLVVIDLSPIVLNETEVPYNSIKDLEGYKVGVVRGVGFEELFPALTFENVTSTEMNVTKMLNNRIPVILEDPLIVNFILQKKYSNHKDLYKVLHPPVFTTPLVIGFSNNKSGFNNTLSIFNKGLQGLKEDGTYERIIKKYNL